MRAASKMGIAMRSGLFIPMRDYEIDALVEDVGFPKVIHPHEGL